MQTTRTSVIPELEKLTKTFYDCIVLDNKITLNGTEYTIDGVHGFSIALKGKRGASWSLYSSMRVINLNNVRMPVYFLTRFGSNTSQKFTLISGQAVPVGQL
jgi:hypothetical protein